MASLKSIIRSYAQDGEWESQIRERISQAIATIDYARAVASSNPRVAHSDMVTALEQLRSLRSLAQLLKGIAC